MNRFSKNGFLALWVFTVLVSFECLGKGTPPTSDTQISILIDRFKMLSGDTSFIFLTEKIPYLIYFSTPINRKVKYVNREVLLNQTKRNDLTVMSEKALNLDDPIVKQILTEARIDYVIAGFFSEYQGQININITLSKGDNISSYSTGYTQFEDLAGKVQAVMKDLTGDLNENVKSSMGKALGVRIRLLDENEKAPELSSLGGIKSNVVDKIKQLEHISLDTILIGPAKTITASTMKKSDINVDVFISEKGGKYRSKTILEFMDRKFELVNPDTRSYYRVKNTLPDEITEYLKGITTPNGQFNRPALAANLDNYDSCITNAKKIFDTNIYASKLFIQKGLQKNTRGAEAYYIQGKIYEKSKQYDLAFESFSKALEYNSSYTDVLFERGNLKLTMGDYFKALEDFDNVARINPNYTDIKYYKAQAFFLLDSINQAIVLLTDVEGKQTPKSIDALFLHGRILYFQNKYIDALPLISRAYKADTARTEYRYGLKNLYIDMAYNEMSKGNYSVANDYANNANKLLNDYQSTWCQISACNYKGDYITSDALIQKAIKLNFTNQKEIYVRQATMLSRNVGTRDALLQSNKYFLAILPQLENPGSAAYRTIGVNYFKLEDFAGAETYYKKALDQEPDQVVNYLNLAELKIIIGKPEDVDDIIKPALKLASKTGIYKVTCLYLLVCSKIVLNVDERPTMNDLDDELTLRKTPNNWSFVTFIDWVNKTNLRPDQKQKLLDLTARVQSSTKFVRQTK